jgi:hypothetical protein
MCLIMHIMHKESTNTAGSSTRSLASRKVSTHKQLSRTHFSLHPHRISHSLSNAFSFASHRETLFYISVLFPLPHIFSNVPDPTSPFLVQYALHLLSVRHLRLCIHNSSSDCPLESTCAPRTPTFFSHLPSLPYSIPHTTRSILAHSKTRSHPQ